MRLNAPTALKPGLIRVTDARRQGLSSRVRGSQSVWGFGFRVWGLGFRVQGLGLSVFRCYRFGVQIGFRARVGIVTC